ncbi:glutathione S-transferase family protein [Shimia marina]|uniref:Maleylacetoacetate isomerase n=1 Tax=Shimia marina TaxID=321267 RepID=A0A0P1FFK0_9RHOB|nr:glutathione S-transferase [Shimia marina]CUH53667.1 maleylacetoacetate isomerase [Shimia marina]SFD71556.1 glutathione S-transferase [Shimia marina]
MIKLYHLNKSRSLRIMWLLEEIGQPYELCAYHRNRETFLAPDALKDIHPLGKAPMLEIDGHLITESAAIVEVLCQRFAPHMLPDASDEAASLAHLQLMHFAEGSAMTPLLLGIYTSRLGEAAAPLHPRIQSETQSHFAYMESLIRPSGHFVLDQLSAVDVMMLFPAQAAIHRLGLAAAFPKLAAFVGSIEAREAFQKAALRDEG